MAQFQNEIDEMCNAEDTKLRDEFAGITLAHLMRIHEYEKGLDEDLDKWHASNRRRLAVQAYKMADEMLFVRNLDISSYKG